MKYLFLVFALLCMAHTNCQDTEPVESNPIVLTPASEGDTYTVVDGHLVKTYGGAALNPVIYNEPPTLNEDNAVFLLAYVGGAAARSGEDTRNGLNYGIEAHGVIKQGYNFGIDFGLGIGYTSLSLPGGKIADVDASASVGFTDNKYISAGVRFSYAATKGMVSPAAYLTLTYPVSDRLSVVGRGTLGVDVTTGKTNYTTGRGQIGVAYSLVR